MKYMQNDTEWDLKCAEIFGEHVFILPAFGKYRILKFHDSTQDFFSPSPSTEFPASDALDDRNGETMRGVV